MMAICTVVLLTVLTVATVGGSIPLLTIHIPDHDLVDCVRREEQHGLHHPLLHGHRVREIPTGMEYTPEMDESYGWQTWHANGTRCPVGSVPIRRVPPHLRNETPGLTAGQRATAGHEYAGGSAEHVPKVYGTQVTMNVWRPQIEGYNEFSLGQTWITSGSYDDNNLNTLEAGWQVYPRMYGDNLPRFFTLWTTDTYNQTHCYNNRCPGFVQISRTVMVEGAINVTSTLGGTQVDLTIRIWVDKAQSCWWLGVIVGQGVLVPVGYWPTAIFTRLRDHAEIAKWGGEIVNTHPFGRHTMTEMGSGIRPGGYGNAAYMRNLQIAKAENVFEPVKAFSLTSTNPDVYRASFRKSDNSALGGHFFYGGPDPTYETASALQLSRDSRVLFLCFGLVWLV